MSRSAWRRSASRRCLMSQSKRIAWAQFVIEHALGRHMYDGSCGNQRVFLRAPRGDVAVSPAGGASYGKRP